MEAASRTTGMDGRLSLRLVSRRGLTVITDQLVSAPFKLFRPASLGDGTLIVQVSVQGPGLRSGDRLAIDISLERGARAAVVFPSFTKLLGAIDGVPAVQECRFSVAEGAQLEYYPGLTIPFPEAVFRQTVRADLDQDVRFGILEMWAAGRVERGEELRFDEIHSRTSISVEGRPAYGDALVLRPQATDASGMGLLEGYRYWASGFWHWDGDTEGSSVCCDGLELVTGRGPRGGLYLRALAQDGVMLRQKLHELVAGHRKGWGLSPVDFGRYTNLFS